MTRMAVQIAVDDRIDPTLTGRLASATITQGLDAPATFSATFAVDVCDDALQLVGNRHLAPTPEPSETLSILVTHDEGRTCLIRGMVTGQTATLRDGGAGSLVEVSGQDRTLLLTRTEFLDEEEGVTFDQVARPTLEQWFDHVHVEARDIQYRAENPLRAAGQSPLEVIQTYAARQGLRFWVDTRVSGEGENVQLTDVAWVWSVPTRDNTTLQPDSPPPIRRQEVLELRINHARSNISDIQVQVEGEQPTTSGELVDFDLETGELQRNAERPPEDPPEATVEEEPGDLVEIANRILDDVAIPIEARAAQQAALEEAQWNVTVRTETTVDVLGTVVSPREPVILRGAGHFSSFRYYVQEVVHNIDPTGHRMSITLMAKYRRPGGEA